LFTKPERLVELTVGVTVAPAGTIVVRTTSAGGVVQSMRQKLKWIVTLTLTEFAGSRGVMMAVQV
jgi:hypothetical protein